VNNWAQTIAIMAAGVWAVYIFIVKEHLQPRAARPHISLELSVRQAGQRRQVTAVESSFVVENRSPKRIYLLTSAYTLIGRTVVAEPKAGESFRNDLDSLFFGRTSDFTRSLAVRLGRSDLLAAGQMFSNVQLGPNESATRKFTNYIAAGRYDAVRLRAEICLADEAGSVNADAMINESNDLQFKVFELTRDGERREISQMDRRGLLDSIHFEIVDREIMVSLWR